MFFITFTRAKGELELLILIHLESKPKFFNVLLGAGLDLDLEKELDLTLIEKEAGFEAIDTLRENAGS